ncbi:DUF485 domain-containing protein [Corynebacterium sp. A21]|uniref:DUF485 domain-containing protein n=1 Tax=Corynebacterium sp. A21 TaxID=3457318 RepID=UPI003FD18DD6
MSATPLVPLDSRREPTAQDFIDMQESPQFQDLRSTYRSFVFPMSIVFAVWYFIYVLAAVYLPELMGVPFLGMNIGMWFGMAQLFTTFLITWLYVRFASQKIEPKAEAIRAQMEG